MADDLERWLVSVLGGEFKLISFTPVRDQSAFDANRCSRWALATGRTRGRKDFGWQYNLAVMTILLGPRNMYDAA